MKKFEGEKMEKKRRFPLHKKYKILNIFLPYVVKNYFKKKVVIKISKVLNTY